MHQLFSDGKIALQNQSHMQTIPVPVPTQAIGRCHVSDIDGTV